MAHFKKISLALKLKFVVVFDGRGGPQLESQSR